MAVYDCFLFFNELDLLEIRLNELNEIVDKFVLVECSTTFSSKKKPFYFEESKERFSKFLDKIIHVKIEDTPNFPNRRGRLGSFHNRHDIEAYQRNCILRGLRNCQPEDIILISDIDEIPKVESIILSKDLLKSNKLVLFKQRLFYYFLNGLCVEKNGKELPWRGTIGTLYKNIDEPEKMRKCRGAIRCVLNNSGWHFSYLGGIENIALKIESIAHAEFDNDTVKNRDRLKNAIEKGIDIFDRHDKQRQIYIKLDATFPKYIINNIEKFSQLIKEI